MDLLFKNVSILFHQQRTLISNSLSKFGIGSGQYIYFLIIHDHSGISQKELTARAGVDKATTAKALTRLMDEGIIEKQENEADRRYFKLHLTEKGRTLISQIYESIRAVRARILAGINDKEAEQFCKLLEKMVYNAEHF